MHHVRITQPRERLDAVGPRAKLQQALGDAGGFLPPVSGGDGQAVRKLPVGSDVGQGIGSRRLVPVSLDLIQDVLQPVDRKGWPVAVAFYRPLRQAVVSQHQPADGLGQWGMGEGLEWRWRAGVDAITSQLVQPTCVVQRRWRGQPGKPDGVIVLSYKRLE